MLFYLFNIRVTILAHKNNDPLNLQREKTVYAKRSTIQAQRYFWCYMRNRQALEDRELEKLQGHKEKQHGR